MQCPLLQLRTAESCIQAAREAGRHTETEEPRDQRAKKRKTEQLAARFLGESERLRPRPKKWFSAGGDIFNPQATSIQGINYHGREPADIHAHEHEH